MGFRLNSALDELSKRDTLTKGGDTLTKGRYTYQRGRYTYQRGRYTFQREIHFSIGGDTLTNNDTLFE